MNEVEKIANELLESWQIDQVDALKIAVEIQRNEIIRGAFVVYQNQPSALERIAMELGAAKDTGTIKDAIYALSGND